MELQCHPQEVARPLGLYCAVDKQKTVPVKRAPQKPSTQKPSTQKPSSQKTPHPNPAKQKPGK